jgi:hypothetical protein
MATNTKPKMALVDLVHTPEWARLSPQQAFFIKEVLVSELAQGTFDPAAACKLAYPEIANQKVWLARLKANPRIKAVLRAYRGDIEAQSLAAEVRTLIKRLRRRNANLDRVYEPLMRITVALEAIAAKENPALR